MLQAIGGIFFGGWFQQILMALACITIIVIMFMGTGIEINVNSKNWIKQSIRQRINKRVIDHIEQRRLRET